MGIEGDPEIAKGFRIPEREYEVAPAANDSTAAGGRRGRPPL